MSLKKSLKRNKKRKGQAMLEYAILVVMSILAILAVNMMTSFQDGTIREDGDGNRYMGFEGHFRSVAAPAGGLDLVE